eukprot:1193989-Prorocentrum_minimum.AAC.2
MAQASLDKYNETEPEVDAKGALTTVRLNAAAPAVVAEGEFAMSVLSMRANGMGGVHAEVELRAAPQGVTRLELNANGDVMRINSHRRLVGTEVFF